MKKVIITALFLGIVGFYINTAANAATVTFTKPTINVDTNKEESALSKKINQTKEDIEKAKAESAAKQEARKKAAEERKKAAEAKQKQRQDAINSFKDSFK